MMMMMITFAKATRIGQPDKAKFIILSTLLRLFGLVL